jgi:hypothetical protein
MQRWALALALLILGCGSGNGQGSLDGGAGGDGTGFPVGEDAATDAPDADSAATDGPQPDAVTMQGTPPFGGASGGSGGSAPVTGTMQQAGGVSYYLIVPSSYAPSTPSPLLVVYSGTEGGQQMTMNLVGLEQTTGIGGFIRAVLDGVQYNGNGAAGSTVLDDVRARYDIDNDRTYLLGESAGTTAALQLGFHLRQSYFAAYWANDVNASDSPAKTAAAIGFAPWGQAGPGGDLPDAQTIVAAMQAAGYRVPSPAPYNGPGSGTHGDPNQFIAALSWFPGKTRQ